MSDPQKAPNWQLTPKLRSRARSLRRDSTRAERVMWGLLRAHRLDGASFRRQTPIGPYIADFVCDASKLIIEIDGGQHFELEHEKRDARRNLFLSSKGFRVLRFTNLDVSNRDGVWMTIADALAKATAPSPPSPASGRGCQVTR